MPAADPTHKLSADQRHLLTELYRPHLGLGEQDLAGHPAFTWFGIRCRFITASASERAATSRTLRRLERRGLLLRQNQATGNPETGECRHAADEPHGRATHVRLTREGLAAAKRLTSGAG